MEEDTESLLGSIDEQYFERMPFETYRPQNGRYLRLKVYNEEDEPSDREYPNDNHSERSNDGNDSTINHLVCSEPSQLSLDHSIIDLA